MRNPRPDPENDPSELPREGTLDAQLSFPASFSFIEAPESISAIRKRDGRTVPFDRTKIADSIFKAAQTVGGDDRDRARSLASGVAIYLAKQMNGQTPTVDQVQDAVEKVLIEMGHAKTALAFARCRDKRARIRMLRGGDAHLLLRELEEARQEPAAGSTPLQDTERITCTPSLEAPGMVHDPEATDRLLAQSLKKRFALTRVLSQAVAVAHVCGDLHVHRLGNVDRLYGSVQSVEYLKQFGPGYAEAHGLARPPKHPEALLGQMVHFGGVLEAHFAGPTGWDALNVFLAPFLHGLSDKDIRQAAQSLIYSCAHQALAQSANAAGKELIISWNVPEDLAGVEAIGPGGEHTGKLYSDYLHPAQQCAWALLDVFRAGGIGGASFPAPRLVIDINERFFKTAGAERFLQHVAETALQRENVHLRLDHGGRVPAPGRVPWQPRAVSVQQVSLNLPRAAYCAAGSGGVEATLMADLERLVEVAVQAHVQKRNFIEGLLAMREKGPLGFLASTREGRRFIDLDQAEYLVAVVGLNECVQAVLGEEIHDSEEAQALAVRVLDALSRLCAAWSDREHLGIALVQTGDETVARRFAALDLERHPEAAARVFKADPRTYEIQYTPGAGLNPDCAVSPIERARIEGHMQDFARPLASTLIRMPDSQTSADTVVSFITKAFYQTRNRRIAFVREK